jgi:hypothetical protein
MAIQVGDRVIHDGTEKTVDQVMGDVLILNDGMAVSPDSVSQVTGSETPETEESQPEVSSEEETTNRLALRNAIEDLNPNTPVSTVMNVMGRVDSAMRINTSVDWDMFKSDIIRRALELRKIDPKRCEACGQIIHE